MCVTPAQKSWWSWLDRDTAAPLRSALLGLPFSPLPKSLYIYISVWLSCDICDSHVTCAILLWQVVILFWQGVRSSLSFAVLLEHRSWRRRVAFGLISSALLMATSRWVGLLISFCGCKSFPRSSFLLAPVTASLVGALPLRQLVGSTSREGT